MTNHPHPFPKGFKGIRVETPPQLFRMHPNGTMEPIPAPVRNERIIISEFNDRNTIRPICKTPHSELLPGREKWAWSTASELFEIVQSNGNTIYKLYCPTCDKRTGALPKWLSEYLFSQGYRPRKTQINNPKEYPPCSYHNCDQPGVDQHHWAPRNTFPDAELWPITALCKQHHTIWHQKMDGYRWAAERTFDDSEIVYRWSLT